MRKLREKGHLAHPLRPVIERLECRQLLSDLAGSPETNPTPALVALEINDSTPIATTLTLTAPSDRIDPVSRSLTLSAEVIDSFGQNVPSGTVYFYFTGSEIGRTEAEVLDGLATAQVPAFMGMNSYTATLQGDDQFDSSSGNLVVDVKRALPQMTLSVTNPMWSLTTSKFQGVSYTSGFGLVYPTGTVTFRDNDQILSTSAVNSDGRSFYSQAPAWWSEGEHVITAHYSGDERFDEVDAEPFSFTNFGHVQVTLEAHSSVLKNQPVELLARIRDGEWTPNGVVTFYDNLYAPTMYGQVLGIAYQGRDFDAALFLSSLAEGKHVISAVYMGMDKGYDGTRRLRPDDPISSGYLTTISEPVVVNVPKRVTLDLTKVGASTPNAPPIFSATFKGVGVNPNAPSHIRKPAVENAAGAQLRLLSTRGMARHQKPTFSRLKWNHGFGILIGMSGGLNGQHLPEGTVKFFDGTTFLAEEPITGGSAMFEPRSMSLGWHSIQAVFEGNADYSPAEDRLDVEIKKAPTATRLQVPKTNLVEGEALELTAVVRAMGLAVPSGWVVLSEGKRQLAKLRLGILARLDLSLPVGTHQITARYLGDDDSLPSVTQTPLTVVVQRQV